MPTGSGGTFILTPTYITWDRDTENPTSYYRLLLSPVHILGFSSGTDAKQQESLPMSPGVSSNLRNNIFTLSPQGSGDE